MGTQEISLKKDGYAGTVPPPVDGVYNQFAYASAHRLSKIVESVKSGFFVMNWEENFGDESSIV